MKNIFLTLASFFMVLHSSNVFATHVLGSDLTYRTIDTSVYEITLTYYRDCNGVPFNNPSSLSKIRCFTGGTANLSFSLVSITEITPLCPSDTPRCDPQNTYGTGKGVEKHVYRTTIDMNSTQYVGLKSCCKLIIESGQCCRASAINTGTSNSNFYNYLELNQCRAVVNNSPIFTQDPLIEGCCNRPLYFNNGVIDTTEYDSLSFHWGNPLTAYGSSASYSGTYYAYNHPFSAFYPGSLTPPYNNPNAATPIGIYLDPRNGDIIFTPTNCTEVTTAVIEVKEWRRDTSGTYQIIGITRREMVFRTASCPDNNPPLIDGPYSYSVPAGNTLCFDITTDDEVFVPPPPTSSPPPDSTKISWNGAIPDATFEVLNPDSLNQTGRFCWTPNDEDIKDLPYYFSVKAKDNHCPHVGTTYKTFSIQVKPQYQTRATIKNKACNEYELSNVLTYIVIDTSLQYIQYVLDTGGNKITDSNLIYPVSIDTLFIDSIVSDVSLFQSGTYLLVREVNSSFYGYSEKFYDTLRVNKDFAVDITGPSNPVCLLEDIHFKAAASDTIGIVQYHWEYGNGTIAPQNATVFSSMMNYPGTDSTYRVFATDETGCTVSDSLVISSTSTAKVDLGKDFFFCGLDTLIQLNEHYLNVTWSNSSTDSTYQLSSSDSVYVDVFDVNGCFSTDTLVVDFVNSLQIEIKDTTVCAKEYVLRTSRSYQTYEWSTGDLSDTTVITQSGTYGIKVGEGGCIAQDSATITFLEVPDPPVLIKVTFDSISANYGSGLSWYRNDTFLLSKAFGLRTNISGAYKANYTNSYGCKSEFSNIINLVLSINEPILANINLYPNPTRGLLVLDYEHALIGTVQTVNLYNSIGQVLQTSNRHTSNKIEITHPKVNGVIIVQIVTDRGVYTKKILSE